MLFLANMLSKMKQGTPLGSRIAEVHNGSALFTGNAGQGESNIRRWIIENDWLEAIVALPLNIFYNTGIVTYIWVLTNRKSERRRGKVNVLFQPSRKVESFVTPHVTGSRRREQSSSLLVPFLASHGWWAGRWSTVVSRSTLIWSAFFIAWARS